MFYLSLSFINNNKLIYEEFSILYCKKEFLHQGIEASQNKLSLNVHIIIKNY